jgi:hypothetical protein
MKTGRLLILIILLSMLFVQGANASEVLYELLPGTLYEEGCVAPCMCPVWISNEVEGTFTLAQTEPDQGYTVYQISQISWNVMGFNELLNHQISGQGMYRLGGSPQMQQMILDLMIDDAKPEHLDSGLVPASALFPAISIPVSRGTQCYDIRMEIKALPAGKPLPIGNLENPPNGRNVSGITTISGWALDSVGISKIELFIDDQFIGNIPYGGTRGDVKTAYPDYPNAENSGFGMIWNYSALAPGRHSIRVRIHNLEGLTKDLEGVFTVVKFHGEFVEKMIPAERWLRNVLVTVDGISRKYDIKLEWSEEAQGFSITHVIPK